MAFDMAAIRNVLPAIPTEIRESELANGEPIDVRIVFRAIARKKRVFDDMAVEETPAAAGDCHTTIRLVRRARRRTESA